MPARQLVGDVVEGAAHVWRWVASPLGVDVRLERPDPVGLSTELLAPLFESPAELIAPHGVPFGRDPVIRDVAVEKVDHLLDVLRTLKSAENSLYFDHLEKFRSK